jgi:hypothetical protein
VAVSVVALLGSVSVLSAQAGAEEVALRATVVSITSIPAQRSCGGPLTFVVTVRNTGRRPWVVPKSPAREPKVIAIGIYGEGGSATVIPVPETILPGETTTFSFTYPAASVGAEFVFTLATEHKGILTEYYEVPFCQHLAVSPAADPDPATAGGTVQLESGASGGSGSDGFDWTIASEPPGGHDQLVNPLTGNPYLIPQLSGTYVVDETVTDSAGDTATGSVTFTVNPAPEVTISLTNNPDDVATPTELQISVSGGTGPDSVSSQLESAPAGSKSQLSDPNTLNPTLLPDLPGDYLIGVTATDANSVTSAPSTITIHVNPPLTASITTGTDPFGARLASASVAGGTGPYTYSWQLTPPPGSSATLTNPTAGPAQTFVPDVPGTYMLEVTITDRFGATATTSTTYRKPFPRSCTAPPGGTCQITAASGTALVTIPGSASVTVTDATTGKVVGILFGPTATFIATVGDNYILTNTSGSPASITT